MDRAAAEGVLMLPAERGRGWDRSRSPAIPLRATLRREAPGRPDRGWRAFPWHPALAWVAEHRTLSSQYVDFLRRVHDGLRDGAFREPAPLKYRSLQLTGDEKRLSTFAKTTLFAPGRLTLSLLGCMPDRPPLAWANVCEDQTALIVENVGLFNVALAVLRQLPRPPYGLVVYGGGRAIERALPGLLEIGRPISQVMYLGDLDRTGLRIALAAARAAERAGAPAVHPAAGLHQAMLDAATSMGSPLGWPSGVRHARRDDAQLVHWLPHTVQSRVSAVLAAGRRIPEEVLGPAELVRVWAESTP